MAEIAPEDVFTPATPVSSEMFATRRHKRLQDRVDGALRERGRQVVLHGDTGVGKTSLVRYLSEEREIPMVEVQCGPPSEDMLREALAQVIGWEEVEQVETGANEGEVALSLVKVVTAKLKASTGKDVTLKRYPTSLGTALAEAFRMMDVQVLFLDNFENLQGEEHYEQTTRSITQLMKAFSDLAMYYGGTSPKVVIAGIPVAAERLLRMDAATARRVAEIEVERMPDEELDDILTKGEGLLGTEFATLARERIIYFSDGFPYYTHLLALQGSRRALARGSRVVELDDFEAALGEVLENVDLSLSRSYADAIETGGEVKVRKSVLHAMASLNDTEVTFQAIREAFLKLHSERYENADQLNFISPEMTKLTEEFGVLQDRGMKKSARNRYRFTNPLMRAFVRLRAHEEAQSKLDV